MCCFQLSVCLWTWHVQTLKFPFNTLLPNSILNLCVSGEGEESQLQTAINDIFITSEHGVTSKQPPPTSILLLKNLRFFQRVIAFCQWKNFIYLCIDDNTIVKMTRNLDGLCRFIRCANSVKAMSVYKDQIYTMQCVYGRRYTASYSIHVYDLSGQEVTQWSCSVDTSVYVATLTIMDDQLIIPDKTNRRLIVYSLDGHLLKYIPCSLLHSGKSSVDMLSYERGSVIICDSVLNKLSKINITTGEVVRTFDGFNHPTQICIYGPHYVLVAQNHGSEIVALNLKTGEIKSVPFLENRDAWFDGYIINMQCVGGTLLLYSYREGSLFELYKINTILP